MEQKNLEKQRGNETDSSFLFCSPVENLDTIQLPARHCID
jgi:hypothetical protein